MVHRYDRQSVGIAPDGAGVSTETTLLELRVAIDERVVLCALCALKSLHQGGIQQSRALEPRCCYMSCHLLLNLSLDRS